MNITTSVLLSLAVRTFFHQRAGQARSAWKAGLKWIDGAGQMGPGQAPQARRQNTLAFTDDVNIPESYHGMSGKLDETRWSQDSLWGPADDCGWGKLAAQDDSYRAFIRTYIWASNAVKASTGAPFTQG